MLKRIPIEKLCIGMYIHEFCGSWYDHPNRIAPELIDLSKPASKDRIASHEDPAKWDIHDIREPWSGLAAVSQHENRQADALQMA